MVRKGRRHFIQILRGNPNSGQVLRKSISLILLLTAVFFATFITTNSAAAGDNLADAFEANNQLVCDTLTQEAENASLVGGFEVGSDPLASGGQYIHAPDGFGSIFSLDEANAATFCISVLEAGVYRFLADVYVLNQQSDSFYVQVDGQPAGGYLWDVYVNSNTWTQDYVSDRNGSDPEELWLDVGDHTITVYLREDGARLDKLELELLQAATSTGAPPADTATSTTTLTSTQTLTSTPIPSATETPTSTVTNTATFTSTSPPPCAVLDIADHLYVDSVSEARLAIDISNTSSLTPELGLSEVHWPGSSMGAGAYVDSFSLFGTGNTGIYYPGDSFDDAFLHNSMGDGYLFAANDITRWEMDIDGNTPDWGGSFTVKLFYTFDGYAYCRLEDTLSIPTPVPLNSPTPTSTLTNTPTATVTFTPTPTLTTGDQFFPYITYPGGDEPNTVAIGDFNNDGRKDTALTTRTGLVSFDFKLYVYLQKANGELDNPVSYDLSGRPESIAVGDLNHDGLDDIAVGGRSTYSVDIYLQNAGGTLTSAPTLSTGGSTDGVIIADLNNDGRHDLAVSNSSDDFLRVFYQDGNGSMTGISPIDYASSPSVRNQIIAGDMNNDGLMDVIKMNGQGSQYPDLEVHLQNQVGTLDPYVAYSLTVQDNVSGVAIGDVTGDNLADAVVVSGGTSGHAPEPKVSVFPQTTQGVLGTDITYIAYNIPESVVIADADLDGLNDVLVLHGGWQNLSVFPQTSAGALGSEDNYFLPYASSYQEQGLAAGDITNDGYPDVVIADSNNGLVVLENKGGPAPTLTPTASFTPTLTDTPDSSCGTFIQEGEDAILTGAFEIGNDASASGGQYIHVPDGAGSIFSLDAANSATFCISVPVAGVYQINSQVYVLNQQSDSFFVRVNGQPASGYLWDAYVGSNQWLQEYVNDRNGSDPEQLWLDAGEHTLEVFLREDGARIDWLQLELQQAATSTAASPTVTETSTATVAPPPTNTVTPTRTDTPQPTATITPTSTPDPTETATITLTNTATITPTLLPLHVQIINPPIDGFVVTDLSQTRFEAEAWDPNLCPTDNKVDCYDVYQGGLAPGINFVEFRISHIASGTDLFAFPQTQPQVGYCAFGGNSPCDMWDATAEILFEAAPNGEYMIEATASGSNGSVIASITFILDRQPPTSTVTPTITLTQTSTTAVSPTPTGTETSTITPTNTLTSTITTTPTVTPVPTCQDLNFVSSLYKSGDDIVAPVRNDWYGSVSLVNTMFTWPAETLDSGAYVNFFRLGGHTYWSGNSFFSPVDVFNTSVLSGNSSASWRADFSGISGSDLYGDFYVQLTFEFPNGGPVCVLNGSFVIPTPTVTHTPTITTTPTITPTNTSLPTLTPTVTHTNTLPPSPTVTHTATVTPTATDTPGPACGIMGQEAEDGILAGAFEIGNDPVASGGQYIHVPDGAGTSLALDESNSATFCITVLETDTYPIHALVYVSNQQSDSFFVKVNGQPAGAYLWDVYVNNNVWELDHVSDRNGSDPEEIYLDVGQHTITVYLREDGARLDYIGFGTLPPGSSGGVPPTATPTLSPTPTVTSTLTPEPTVTGFDDP